MKDIKDELYKLIDKWEEYWKKWGDPQFCVCAEDLRKVVEQIKEKKSGFYNSKCKHNIRSEWECNGRKMSRCEECFAILSDGVNL